MQIPTFIVEDDADTLASFKWLLAQNFPELQVLGHAGTVAKAVEQINLLNPVLVFMDVELEDGTGFDVLQQLLKLPPALVFTTSHQEHAVKAFDFSAMHYLLKPVGLEDMAKVMQRLSKLDLSSKESPQWQQTQINTLLHNLQHFQQNMARLMVPTQEGFEVVNVQGITHCISDGSYTELHFLNAPKMTSSKNLKDYEDLLSPYAFLRVHRSALINLQYVQRYVKGRGGYVVLTNGTELEVSRARKDILLERIKGQTNL